MASDPGVRNLEHLEHSASTARVLNLRALFNKRLVDPDYNRQPLFKNKTLNTSIIVKHRLRGNETELFSDRQRVATKLLIPIDAGNLAVGARYVFVGQTHFKEILLETIGMSPAEAAVDLKTLSVLDAIPTLDPFLLREQLRRYDLQPARCYFELSQSDTERMLAFAQREIEALVRLSIDPGAKASEQAKKLAKRILTNSGDAELEPLRRTLQLDEQRFEEGAFCWKAFLYYKWQLTDLLPRVAPVLKEIATIKPVGPASDENLQYLATAREKLRRAIVASCRGVRATLDVYDTAYKGLTERSDPSAFRDFLLKAPSLFTDLGERLGGVEHIVSFWRYRFPPDKRPVVTPAELTNVFMDFEGSVGLESACIGGGLPKPPIIDATGAAQAQA